MKETTVRGWIYAVAVAGGLIAGGNAFNATQYYAARDQKVTPEQWAQILAPLLAALPAVFQFFKAGDKKGGAELFACLGATYLIDDFGKKYGISAQTDPHTEALRIELAKAKPKEASA